MHRYPKASSVQSIMHNSQTHILGRPAPTPGPSSTSSWQVTVYSKSRRHRTTPKKGGLGM